MSTDKVVCHEILTPTKNYLVYHPLKKYELDYLNLYYLSAVFVLDTENSSNKYSFNILHELQGRSVCDELGNNRLLKFYKIMSIFYPDEYEIINLTNYFKDQLKNFYFDKVDYCKKYQQLTTNGCIFFTPKGIDQVCDEFPDEFLDDLEKYNRNNI